MLNTFSKTLLFITSYSPLFLILVILDFNSGNDYFFDNPVWVGIIVFIVVLCAILAFFLLKFVLYRYLDFKYINDNVKQVENSNHEVMAYLFSYVIPFISVSDSKKILILSVLLFVTYVIFIKSELLKYNILFLIFGFDIIKVTFDSGCSIFLLKPIKTNINIGQKIIGGKISDNIYFLNR